MRDMVRALDRASARDAAAGEQRYVLESAPSPSVSTQPGTSNPTTPGCSSRPGGGDVCAVFLQSDGLHEDLPLHERATGHTPTDRLAEATSIELLPGCGIRKGFALPLPVGEGRGMTDPTPAGRLATPSDPGVSGELRKDTALGDTDLTRWYTPWGRALAAVARAIGAKLGPYAALLLTLGVGAALAFGLSIAAVEVYDAVTDADGVAGIDQPLLNLALSLRTPAAAVIVTVFTDIAGTIGMPVIAVVAMVVLGIKRRSWTPVVLIIAAGAGSLLMTIAGKELIQRQRPPLIDAVPPFEYSPSFPSGHTLNAVAVVGIIAYLLVLRRESTGARVAIISGAVLFAALVAASRVYLGHHWFTDVLVGWLLGAAWLSFIITAHRLYLTARAHHHRLTSNQSLPPQAEVGCSRRCRHCAGSLPHVHS